MTSFSPGIRGTKMATGTYTGDGTQNRAIAHGLGRLPKYVTVIGVNTTYDGHSHGIDSHWRTTHNSVDYAWDSTAWTTTNFYIGNAVQFSGNANTLTYYWAAFG